MRKEWGGKLSVALVYPNAYRLGMSNLGVSDRVPAPERSPGCGGGAGVSARRSRVVPLPSDGNPAHGPSNPCARSPNSISSPFPCRSNTTISTSSTSLNWEGSRSCRRRRDRFHPLVLAGGSHHLPEPRAPRGLHGHVPAGRGRAGARRAGGPAHGVPGRCTRAHRGAHAPGGGPSHPSNVPSLYEVGYGDDGTIDTFRPTVPGIPDTVKSASRAGAAGYVSRSHHRHARHGIRRQGPHGDGPGLRAVVPVLCGGLRVSGPRDPTMRPGCCPPRGRFWLPAIG